MHTDIYLLPSIKAALMGGDKILQVYNTDFSVTEKSDHSPLTLADQQSHDTIVSHLTGLGLPILSEEGKDIAYDERKEWEYFWMVDPLDGTKEFIQRNGEFTVNIALIHHQTPVFGIVFIPVNGTMYFSTPRLGAYKLEDPVIRNALKTGGQDVDLEAIISQSQRLPDERFTHTRFTIVGSRSHASAELQDFVEKKRREYGDVDFISAGSSLKFCVVAEGRADVYPRLGPTMEWDTAAGQVIAENAGAKVWNYHTNTPLIYNKENLLNPWFVVSR
jgi:3'(2'), 5'-bisphosphate nucleotidase